MRQLLKYVLFLASVVITKDAIAQLPGALDSSFGKDGILTTTFNGYETSTQSISVQANGKMVVSGSLLKNVGGFDSGYSVLTRYNVDGSLDSKFGMSGIVIDNFVYKANALLLQPDGKIIVGGFRVLTKFGGYDFALIRFNTDGTKDSTFGKDGNVSTHLGSDGIINAISIQHDGKIIAIGYTTLGNSIDTLAIVRYNTNGSFDSSFGVNGVVMNSLPYSSEPQAAAIQSDGKIVIAGDNALDATFFVIRFNPNGSIDSSFGLNGSFTDNTIFHFGSVRSIIIEQSGKIILAGSSKYGDSFILGRLNQDGTYNSPFGPNGYAFADFNAFDISFSQLCNAVIKEQNGKLVAAGSIYYNASKRYSIGLARFNADGLIDSSFGTDGLVSTLLDSNTLSVTGVALDSNGRIVVVGYANNNFLLVRYFADLKLDVLDLSTKNIAPFAYPNPLRVGDFTLEYELLKPEAISIALINEDGKQVFSFMKNNYRNAGKQKEILPIPSTLPLGAYLLNVFSPQENFRVKIMKSE
jgi:uncharacterized delta-60 repeat protein